MTMTILPSIFLSIATCTMNVIALILAVCNGEDVSGLLMLAVHWCINVYWMVFTLGLITTVTERKQIHCSTKKKILYMFTFPIYLLSYIPISVAALFKQVKWEPIKHGNACTIKVED